MITKTRRHIAFAMTLLIPLCVASFSSMAAGYRNPALNQAAKELQRIKGVKTVHFFPSTDGYRTFMEVTLYQFSLAQQSDACKILWSRSGIGSKFDFVGEYADDDRNHSVDCARSFPHTAPDS